ncbi:hypothetical protein LCGC14_0991660 [marine sediment metagenome]|uniref:Uncharacterized protein n=1 Tax=marine sediment metagenome TaxID=412755 RepID=A0A0F9NS75_9ZZZZ
MKQCKAKSKRTDKRCKAYVVKGMEVCYYHGGKLGSTKARRARRQAALRHGFYTKENIAERKALVAFMRETKGMLKEI